ncbi:MAG: phosphotransferase [Oscillospiraceae bacterium]
MDQIKIGRFIAKRRKEHGLLQKDVAQKLGISEKTVSKWECGNGLPEVVFMEPLCRLLGITVNELLAGEAIPIFEMLNLLDRSRLELVKQLEYEQLRMRIYKLYDIDIDSAQPLGNGAGGLTYLVTSGYRKYVVKYPSDNEMNHPETEIRVCERLLQKGIPACKFIPNKHGKKLSSDENGRRFTVQAFYSGVTYDYNESSEIMRKRSAEMLARIHMALKDIDGIPNGIGADFFKYRVPENMTDSYAQTLRQALDNSDAGIADEIRSNIRVIGSMPRYKFEADKFSCGNTHGDYMISQLIWNNEEISGVIDWTCACVHPYIWEIVRSYVFMAPEVKRGEINIDSLLRYISDYMEYGLLNAYDIENAGRLFYYFLAVCNFYGQYYDSISQNRFIYLKQAEMSSKLLRWFEKHIDELDEKLSKLSARTTGYNKL